MQDRTHLNAKNIGREASCDLVLEHTSASRKHAAVELHEDGSVWVTDTDSRNGAFLHRNDAWIRIRKVTLCSGDRIRFGDAEVTLQQLTAVFGKRARPILGEQHFSLRQGRNTNRTSGDRAEQNASMHKPKRNPLTGLLE